MKKQIIKKLNQQSGESLAETLVALLIAALALVMLASMISSTTRIVTRSKETMSSYYNENNLVGIDHFIRLIKDCKYITELTPAIMLTLIDKILVSQKNPETNEQLVQIFVKGVGSLG